ncbi:MAG: adenylate/guanylate cyclase domain-containing protein, partial [Rhodospirillales bacterium]
VSIARDALAGRVAKQGHSVVKAADGLEALEALASGSFDLVLPDLVMPNMDGYEVLERMKADQALRDIPVIIITSVEEMDSVIRCIEAGADDYMLKTVEPELLQARIKASLEKKHWRDWQRQHVDQVVDAMAKIERGQTDVRLDVIGDDIYARLYSGFNMMTHGLEDAARILEIAQDLSGELQIEVLFERIIAATTQLLDADRSTLFVHDRKTGELWSLVAEGLDVQEIRLPSTAGLAGMAFTSGETLNISDPYNHPAFNRDFDDGSGYKTESILCMPITNKAGEHIGVTQVLNKKGGVFEARDEARLRAFTSQIAVTLDSAQLFDEVLTVKNYNDSILKSTTNGLITFDAEHRVVTVNEAAHAILHVPAGDELIGLAADVLFTDANAWIANSIAQVEATGDTDTAINEDLILSSGDKISMNLTVVPLVNADNQNIGSMAIIEDITDEKRIKTTMARYMSKEVADQLLAEGESQLGGKSQKVSILFSDLRNFTRISESLGPTDTVDMLNNYFSEMVDVIFRHRGILDKYIGDAIMALFGAPLEGPNDADNALAVANEMMTAVTQINGARSQERLNPIDIGIGIGTGTVIAGSIGSTKRMDYTVIGDRVNLAARLESANKFYGTHILVCEYTVADLKIDTLMREIDLMRVVGKDEAVAVFEAMAYHDELTFPNMSETLEAYDAGLASYRDGDWREAQAHFIKALEFHPDDGPSKIYAGRCQNFAAAPPAADWDGIWVLEEK